MMNTCFEVRNFDMQCFEMLNHEVLKIILNDVGHNVCPIKFYNMRLVSRDFRNIIDDYKDGFYFYIINYLRLNNCSYNDEFINSKLRINKPISMKFGFKILHLDDWYISENYEYKQLPYPKYVKINDDYIYVLEDKLIEPLVINEYAIEINEYEKYYNMMMRYNLIFNTIKNIKVIKWIKNNEK